MGIRRYDVLKIVACMGVNFAIAGENTLTPRVAILNRVNLQRALPVQQVPPFHEYVVHGYCCHTDELFCHACMGCLSVSLCAEKWVLGGVSVVGAYLCLQYGLAGVVHSVAATQAESNRQYNIQRAHNFPGVIEMQ